MTDFMIFTSNFQLITGPEPAYFFQAEGDLVKTVHKYEPMSLFFITL